VLPEVLSPRRSRRMTHLRSVKVTHTKNTFSPVFAKVLNIGGATINIIHAEGVALGQSECRHQDACHAADLRSGSVPFLGSSVSRIRPPRLADVVGHFWRANPGHFPRAPKLTPICGERPNSLIATPAFRPATLAGACPPAALKAQGEVWAVHHHHSQWRRAVSASPTGGHCRAHLRPPLLVKALEWMFLESDGRRAFERLALRVFGLKKANQGS
jgi:hypothetical protein